jgi:hypothetical protein
LELPQGEIIKELIQLNKDEDIGSDNKDTAVVRTSYIKKFPQVFKHYET